YQPLPPPPPPAPTAVATVARPVAAKPKKPLHKRRWPWVVGVIAALVALLCYIEFVWAPNPTEQGAYDVCTQAISEYSAPFASNLDFPNGASDYDHVHYDTDHEDVRIQIDVSYFNNDDVKISSNVGCRAIHLHGDTYRILHVDFDGCTIYPDPDDCVGGL